MVSSPSLSSLPGTNGFIVVTTELVTFTLPDPRQVGHLQDPDTFVLFSSLYSNTTPFPSQRLHTATRWEYTGLSHYSPVPSDSSFIMINSSLDFG